MPSLSDTPYLHDNVNLVQSTLGRFVELGEGTRIIDSEIGDYSYTDRYVDIAYSKIGKFCNIAAFSRINPSEHPYHRASLHHFMYRSSYYWPEETDEATVFDWRRSRPVHVGHDTWIGHGTIIMKGVTIGNGAVVGSKSVVTKDVPPFAIVAGTPAKIIKWRHGPDIAERLQALAWWEWSHGQIRSALPDFRALSAEAFLEKYEMQETAVAVIQS
jgi:phosphonate metabolism protein (transferase hexapeptide repeat family)